MERYASPVQSYSYGKRKGRHKGLKIFLIILLGIVVILGILFAINFNTIMVFNGKGHINVKQAPQIKQSMTGSGMFEDVGENTDSNGNSVMTGVSKDKAVTLTVTKQKDGTQVINAQVDTSKLDDAGIDLTALKNGNAKTLQAAKDLADKYVGTIVDDNSKTGMELYMASKLYNQYKNNPNDINISHSFGDTDLTVTGDMSQHKLDVTLKKK